MVRLVVVFWGRLRCGCICMFVLLDFGMLGRRFSYDPVESWCGTSSYVGS
jgi:hypothetical protein